MKHKLVVGQKVFLKTYNRYNNELREVTINTISEKFFTIKEERLTFCLETLKDQNSIVYPSRIYITKQNYDDEIELNELNSLLKNLFNHSPSFSLDQLRKVAEILDLKLE